jgi:hypothetical protein
MMHNQPLVCLLLALCSACTTRPSMQADKPASASEPGNEWSVTVTGLEGPIDPELPKYGIILYDFRVCAGSHDRMAVVWTRSDWLFSREAEWDADAHVWRLKEGDRTFKPLATTETAPGGKPNEPSRGTIFPPGQCIGAAIISPKGVLKRTFLETIDADDGSESHFVGPVLLRGEEWTIVFNLQYPFLGNAADLFHRQPNPRVQLVALNESGWGDPSAPKKGKVGRGIQIAGDENPDGFFFLTYFNKALDPPDFMGGHDRERLNYMPLSEGATSRVVYTRPYEFAEDEHQIVSMGSGRYDLIARRYRPPGLRRGQSYKIIHVPDLLRGGERQGAVIGECPDGVKPVAIRRGRDLQILWFEMREGDDRAKGGSGPCLMEAHYDGSTWSKPRVVCRVENASLSQLTAAARPDGAALAVWPSGERDHKLTYSVSSETGNWSAPRTTDVTIGWRFNQLVGVESGFFLLTENDEGRNRYWCYLDVHRARAVPEPAQNVDRLENRFGEGSSERRNER